MTVGTRRCPQCGEENPVGSHHCAVCGASLDVQGSRDEIKPRVTIRNLSTGNWIAVIFACVAIVSFFLPWVSSYALGITLISKYSGYKLASMGTSKASGLPGWPYFITLAAAVVCLVLCALYARYKSPNKSVLVSQIVLAVIGLFPFILLNMEVGHWSTVPQWEFGLGSTVIGMIGIIVGAIWAWHS